MSSDKFKKNIQIYKEYLDRKRTIKNPVNFGEFLYGLGEEYTGYEAPVGEVMSNPAAISISVSSLQMDTTFWPIFPPQPETFIFSIFFYLVFYLRRPT